MKNVAAGLFMAAFVVVLVLMLNRGGPDWQARDVLVYGRGSDAKSLDPTQIDDGESVKVVVNINETLVRVDFENALQPCLATTWTPRADGKPGYVFTIREKVRFHDGTPLTAEVVAWNLERLRTSNSGYVSFYAGIEKASVTADGKVEVALKEPDATLLINLAMFPAAIVSKTAVEQLGADYGLKGAVGTGPFKFSKWVRDHKLVLTRNDAYWGPKAGVSGIEFIQVRDNTDRFRLLKNGDLAYIDNPNPQDLQSLGAGGELTYKQRKTGAEISLLYMAMNTRVKPFDNVTFRQAIAHALDKQQISRLYYGTASAAHLAVPPGIHGHAPDIAGFPLDVEKAKRLLAESGVKEREFTLSIMANPRPYIRQPAEVGRAIRGALKKIGIELKIEKQAWKSYLDYVQSAKHQLCLLGWTTDNGDADNFLSTFYHSSNATLGSALNVSFFNDPKMDGLLKKARTTVDPAARKAVLAELYTYAREQSPIVPLIYAQDAVAYHRALENVRLHPLSKKFLWPIKIKKPDKD